ncbi:MAG TPA: arginine--tRNA ligase [Bacteroidales bacterium]|nr:arginine--tRNA ligase [Bacteroidales bacterium]
MIEKIIAEKASDALKSLYGQNIDPKGVAIQKTRPEFQGDFTVVVFPLTRFSGKSPEETGRELGEWLKGNFNFIADFNIIKGFLNILLTDRYWMDFFSTGSLDENFGFFPQSEGPPVVIEYSSPNTNKPLHLGHIRNNLLGWSIAEILKANGRKVMKVNLVNDRGIHICKTMLAYRKWASGKIPSKEGIKGDKFVGNLYVQFEQANKKIMETIIKQGIDEDEAYRQSGLTQEALDLLQQWESGDPDARRLWETMNGWVYEGFDQTYRRLGVDFDKIYYESETYLLGKDLVAEGLDKGVFYKKDDGSVWIDLKDFKLDEKLLLRPDGTSVYITQDLGTAQLRVDDYHPGRLLYVVGNEQIYHFDVLKIVLKLLGRDWAENILHVSYGMVELPQGKMKSREGTVVDADELMEEMYETAKKTTAELGKLDNPDDPEWRELFEMLGMGALKFFILRVDPRKNMLFNPQESIDFNGHTGPFIQYTHARIRSLLAKASGKGYKAITSPLPDDFALLPKERAIVRLLYDFPAVVADAGNNLSPAIIAAYCYELAKEYNQFYQEIPVLKEPDPLKISFRLALSGFAGNVLRRGMGLLGIRVPEKM